MVVLGFFLQLTGCIKMPLIATCRVKNLDADQRVYIYVGTEEADDTDKTLMAGNIKQAYIDSSLSYYHDLIARGVDLENIKIHIQSGAEHNEEAWAENLPDCLRFFAEKWD